VPLIAYAETAESSLRPWHWPAVESRWAQTIRADGARAIGNRPDAEAYGMHKGMLRPELQPFSPLFLP
jgi:hypothetical protein